MDEKNTSFRKNTVPDFPRNSLYEFVHLTGMLRDPYGELFPIGMIG